jgi:hypothetical protein
MTLGLDRRRVLQVGTRFVAAGAIGGVGACAEGHDGKMAGVTPPEDLMREHGVLSRILLIYEAAIRNFSDGQSFDPLIISRSAQIIRQFIEDYHERIEENHVFPRFRRRDNLVELVNVLEQQHQVGRRLTDVILRLAPITMTPSDDRNRLMGAMQAYIRMYRPHEAPRGHRAVSSPKKCRDRKRVRCHG